MTDIQKRLERKAIPDPKVGIIIQTTTGWEASYTGHETKPFATEQEARQYLSNRFSQPPGEFRSPLL